MKTEKVYYFISNSDNQIHKTDESGFRFQIDTKEKNYLSIQILGETDEILGETEIIDEVVGYETLGDLMEAINGGGNDLE